MAEWNFEDMVEDYGMDYLGEERPDDELMSMDYLDEIYSGESPMEVLRRAFFGGRYGFEKDSFNPNDMYFYFNGYGNLVSVHEFDKNRYLMDVINEEEFKDWCISQNCFDPEESADEYDGDDYSEGLGGPDADE